MVAYKTTNHGYKKRQILTIGNVELNLILPYVVERNNKNNQKSKTLNQGFCPFLRWLSMEEGVTPLVWSNIAKYGAISSSFDAARQTLIDWGINISLKRVERKVCRKKILPASFALNLLFWLNWIKFT